MCAATVDVYLPHGWCLRLHIVFWDVTIQIPTLERYVAPSFMVTSTLNTMAAGSSKTYQAAWSYIQKNVLSHSPP
jgi:hypothetical protein